MSIELRSQAFEHGGVIPKKYSCDAENVSPPLQWDSAPAGTKSYALICEDPDAPGATFVHWVLFNIPADVNRLPENLPPNPELDEGMRQGHNDFKDYGYGGPCPPSGEHRYYFKMYALNSLLDEDAGVTKEQLES
ncbi:YbhB/YbcL family Raf kinase inhibitor-like protein, partial [bacterium]|nr:YbhB/YbcL family Raf kinase inhibitor-like protein [bacterium]